MSRLTNYDCDPKQLSPLTLAFVGDGVFDLFVREEIVCSANRPVGELNKLKVERVRCEAQARLYERIAGNLTDEEADIFRRGRNAHPHTVPAHASRAQYGSATALETLFGWLYLTGQRTRANELFRVIMEEEA